MTNNTEKLQKVKGYDLADDFTCPDCRRTSKEGVYDAGNGFCQYCASDH